jgi:hypothetical protein
MLPLKSARRSGIYRRRGRSPFAKWLRALNVQAAAKVTTALERVAEGNLSNVKTVGSGVSNTGLILALAIVFTSGETATA